MTASFALETIGCSRLGVDHDVCHCEHIAGMRIHQDRPGATSTDSHHLAKQRLLGCELQRAVDREHEVVARLRRLDALTPDRDGAALAVALTHETTGHTGEARVVRTLDARHADVVDVDASEDGARELS